MAILDQQIQLPDGRRLGYDEYGEPDGQPLFYFHGTPSSRKEWRIFGDDALARKLGARVIVPDRPGMGLSDFQRERRVSDWPADVAALADHLGLSRFAVLGYSGGSPYALACARMIPKRLTRVGIVSGVASFETTEVRASINAGTLQFLNLAREKPWLSRLSLRLMALAARHAPGRLVAQASSILPEPDQRIMARPEAGKAFAAMVAEAVRGGPRGAQHDGALMVSPWPFNPSEIKMEVQFWHGEADQNAPVAMAQYLEKAIPLSHARYYPHDGHLSVLFHRIEEILTSLTHADATEARPAWAMPIAG